MPRLSEALAAYAGKRVLLTGQTGFKGAWLALWLVRLGARVTGLALDPPTTPSLFDLAQVGEVIDDRRGDVRDLACLNRVLAEARPEVIFHLAAQSLVRLSHAEPLLTFQTNALGTLNLLEAVRLHPTARAVVLVTTDKVYLNPERVQAFRETDPLGGADPYSASKAAAEIIAAAYDLSFLRSAGVNLATARAGNVLGGGDYAQDRIIPDAVRALLAGQPVPVRNPGAVRPWQHVLEPLAGYLMLGLKSSGEGATGPWNFGPGAESCVSVAELVELFIQAWGAGEWTDLSAGQAGAPREMTYLALAWDKAFRLLGWRPRWGLTRTAAATAQWYRRQAQGESARDLCLEQIQAYEGEA